jgi:putative NIF3 family GTP cyclohydrolase 1 type 2
MTKLLAPLPSLLLALSAVSAAQEGAKMTAREVIAEITQHVGVPPRPDTVDTFKAGDPDTSVTGVAVTMMATQDVLERADKAGKNLVITHEPTFYNHLDKTADLEGAGDAVLAAKLAFIKGHHLVVWRFHDGWHARKPDGILLGMTRALGWLEYQSPDEPRLFNIPETSLGDLASSTKKKLKIKVPRVVGDPDIKVKRVALMPGAAGSPRQIKLLEREDVEALVIGETPE